MSSRVIGNALTLPGSGEGATSRPSRSEEHTSELQSQSNLVCRLLLEKTKEDTYPRFVLLAHLLFAFPSLLLSVFAQPLLAPSSNVTAFLHEEPAPDLTTGYLLVYSGV